MSKKSKVKRPRLLSLLLAIVLVVCVLVNGICIYDLFGNTIQSFSDAKEEEKEDVPTEEEQQAKEEREAEQKEKEEMLEKGNINYEPSFLQNTENNVISNERSAMEMLIELEDELGIEDAENEYRCTEKKENDSYDYYYMQQYYDGFEISGAQLVVTVDKSGQLVNISGQYFSIDKLDTEVGQDYSDIENAVEKYMKSEYQLNADEYFVDNEGVKIIPFDIDDFTVGYRVVITLRDGLGIFTTLILDGNTGDVVGDFDGIVYEMITLDSEDAASPNHKLMGQDGMQTLDVYRDSDERYKLVDTDRNIEVFVHDRSVETTNEQEFEDSSPEEWNPKSENPDASAVDALANLQRIYDFYKDNLNIYGVQNNKRVTLPVMVGINVWRGNNFRENAAMSGNSYMLVGTREGNHEYSAELNVMAHEYTHGVVSTFSTIFSRNFESNSQYQACAAAGINEGLADIFGELAEDYDNNGKLDNDCDWRNSVRDMNNPDMDNYSNFIEYTTDCHDSASLVTHPFYRMAAFDNNIDTATLTNLYFDTFPQLTGFTGFKDFRNILEKNAAKMTANYYKIGPNLVNRTITDGQLETVIDAFDIVGIPTSFEKTVVTSGTLKVYGKNNKIYDNYNIKIRRLMDTSNNLLDEDVSEQEFKIPSTISNGIYSVLLTDLEDENMTYTFSLVINNNVSEQKVDKYPDVCKVYTEFGTVARDVVLVLDVSGSMNGEPINQTRASAEKFVNTVLSASPSTRISIVTYSGDAKVLIQASNKKSTLKKIIRRISDGGGTNTYSGLKNAENILDSSNTKKKMVVLMSDGAPNQGENDNGDYAAPIIKLADNMKSKDITIYSLGFFHNLSGDELIECQSLMSRIASPGYYYMVDNIGNYEFDVENPESELYKVFNDLAEQINGKKYINIRIACPVDVTVTYNGETLSSDEDNLNTRTSFGSMFFETEEAENEEDAKENQIKTLRLEEGIDYEICINGTGKGTMDYTISYPDEEGEYTDIREFKKVPITKETLISTNTKSSNKTTMKVDTDGDGRFDLNYEAEVDSKAEVTDINIKFLCILSLGILSLILLLIEIILVIKRIKYNKICHSCGAATNRKESFCSNCGAEIHRKRLLLPEKIDRPKQSKGVIIAKLVVIILCAGTTLAVTTAYQSPASNVYKQLRDNEVNSAKMIYKNNIDGSKISDMYLSFLMGIHIDRAEGAYENERLTKADFCTMLECVQELEIGSASDKAENLLDELGVEEEKTE